jgi:putative ABC transport system permease protein
MRAYLLARPLTTLLTVLLVAIGIATMVVVTLVTAQAERQMSRDAQGIDLVVGAKGSRLQLVLAGVYHLDVPPGNVPLGTLASLRADRRVARAIPLSLGDSFRGFRIVGTEPAYAALHDARIARGRMFGAPFEAVLGARVAAESGLGAGARFVGSHGLAAGGPEHDAHPFEVVGVLAPTGGVIDRLVLTPLESVWLAHEGEPTMVLLTYASPIAAATMPRAIDASDRLQAASPAVEAARLFRLVGVGVDGVRAFGLLLLAMAALSVFVALFQALSDRRRELALMRLLGASPARLFALLMGEGVLLVALGVLLGLVLGHAAVGAAGAWLAPRGEMAASGLEFDTMEAVYVAGALALGGVAALVPAWLAARTPLDAALADDR